MGLTAKQLKIVMKLKPPNIIVRIGQKVCRASMINGRRGLQMVL